MQLQYDTFINGLCAIEGRHGSIVNTRTPWVIKRGGCSWNAAVQAFTIFESTGRPVALE